MAQNYLIRSVVLDILSEVKEIKLQLKNNSQEINTHGKEQIISVFNNKDNDINFPLKTEEELQIVEVVLENDDEITKAVSFTQTYYIFILKIIIIIYKSIIRSVPFDRKWKYMKKCLILFFDAMNSFAAINYCNNQSFSAELQKSLPFIALSFPHADFLITI